MDIFGSCFFENKIHFASYLRDSLVHAEEAKSLDHYQTDCIFYP